MLMPPTACESEWGPALQEQEFESNEVRVSLLVDVDDDTLVRGQPFRKGYLPVKQTRAREYLETRLYRRATTKASR